MKKICKVLLVCLLSVSLFGCNSDESEVKKMVSSYLDCLKDKDLVCAANVTGENLDVNTVPDQASTLLDVMFQKFDYEITSVEVNEADAIVTLDVTNVNFNDLKDKAAENLEENNPEFESLSAEEKANQIGTEASTLIGAIEPVSQSVTVKFVKNEEEKWIMTKDNTAFAKSLVGDQ